MNSAGFSAVLIIQQCHPFDTPPASLPQLCPALTEPTATAQPCRVPSRAKQRVYLGRYEFRCLVEHVLWTANVRPQEAGEEAPPCRAMDRALALG